jgi:hypothetical protein
VAQNRAREHGRGTERVVAQHDRQGAGLDLGVARRDRDAAYLVDKALPGEYPISGRSGSAAASLSQDSINGRAMKAVSNAGRQCVWRPMVHASWGGRRPIIVSRGMFNVVSGGCPSSLSRLVPHIQFVTRNSLPFWFHFASVPPTATIALPPRLAAILAADWRAPP